MPHSKKREKELLAALVEHDLSLEKAMAYFSKSASNLDKQASELGLRRLLNYDLITIINKNSAEEAGLEDKVLNNPQNYTVKLNSFTECENTMSELYEDSLSQDIEEIAKNHYFMDVLRRDGLRIYGDLEGAMTLAERARTFTHQFAFHLITKSYEKAREMFSTVLISKKTVEALKEDIENLYKYYGEFELFDHVQVSEVFNGPKGWGSALDREWWPKDTDKAARRAMTTFELGSMLTPGGLMIDGGYYMALLIIEENGLFKVLDYKFYTGN